MITGPKVADRGCGAVQLRAGVVDRTDGTSSTDGADVEEHEADTTPTGVCIAADVGCKEADNTPAGIAVGPKAIVAAHLDGPGSAGSGSIGRAGALGQELVCIVAERKGPTLWGLISPHTDSEHATWVDRMCSSGGESAVVWSMCSVLAPDGSSDATILFCRLAAMEAPCASPSTKDEELRGVVGPANMPTDDHRARGLAERR